jgi:hypothetical protein
MNWNAVLTLSIRKKSSSCSEKRRANMRPLPYLRFHLYCDAPSLSKCDLGFATVPKNKIKFKALEKNIKKILNSFSLNYFLL